MIAHHSVFGNWIPDTATHVVLMAPTEEDVDQQSSRKRRERVIRFYESHRALIEEIRANEYAFIGCTIYELKPATIKKTVRTVKRKHTSFSVKG